MFPTNCQAAVSGRECRRTRNWRVWCHQFEAEQFDGATWVSVCSWHLHRARRIVSMLEG